MKLSSSSIYMVVVASLGALACGPLAKTQTPTASPVTVESQVRFEGESGETAHGRWLELNRPTLGVANGEDVTGTEPVVAPSSPRDLAKPLAAIGTAGTVWTAAQLTAGFEQLRDGRLIGSDVPHNINRRLSWLYPDDGCYARAGLGGYLLALYGQPRPTNIFIFGSLTVQTANAPSGKVTWGYHVAPFVVVDGKQYVLDPAIEPTRPLLLSEWIGRQTASADGVNLAVCDLHSTDPNGQCLGGGVPDVSDNQWMIEQFLPAEWQRQLDLKRDPFAVLDTHPLW